MLSTMDANVRSLAPCKIPEHLRLRTTFQNFRENADFLRRIKNQTAPDHPIAILGVRRPWNDTLKRNQFQNRLLFSQCSIKYEGRKKTFSDIHILKQKFLKCKIQKVGCTTWQLCTAAGKRKQSTLEPVTNLWGICCLNNDIEKCLSLNIWREFRYKLMMGIYKN